MGQPEDENSPPETSQPHPARTRSSVSRVIAAHTSTSAISTTYVGAITRVGSRRVRQSMMASATPTGTSGSRNSRGQAQPSDQPTSAPATPESSAARQASLGSRR
jgi:hypothetical protein